ncbi:MAG: substrate-binding domain-containing protein [Planctomycetota bacterium]
MKTRFMPAALLGFCMLVGFCLGGCREAPRDDGKIVIGLAVPSLTHPFFIYLRNSIVDEAEELGVEIRAMDAEDMAAKQTSIIEDFIVRGVDGVLLAPIGADSLVPAVEALNQAGIPVATVDRKVHGGRVLAHVGADNVEGGRVAARYLIEKTGGDGRIIELEGTPGASPAIDRKKGFHEVIDSSNMEVIASQTADFKRVKGQSVMENLLQVHSDFEGVYAANDEMMLGATEAMEANDVEGSEVVTVGYDAIPDALDYIREGRLDATVEQYPGRQARTALRILVEHIRDGSTPKAKQIDIKPVIIDAESLDQAEEKGAMRVE